MLFQADLSQEEPSIEAFVTHHRISPRVREFTEHIVKGVSAHRDLIDRVIATHSTRWPLDRMGAIDRNVLRIGVFELLFDQLTPPKVVIDEAIEIAKKFGSGESHIFINGVLDAVHHAQKQEKT